VKEMIRSRDYASSQMRNKLNGAFGTKGQHE